MNENSNPRAQGPTSMPARLAVPTKHCNGCGCDFGSLDGKCPACTSKP